MLWFEALTYSWISGYLDSADSWLFTHFEASFTLGSRICSVANSPREIRLPISEVDFTLGKDIVDLRLKRLP